MAVEGVNNSNNNAGLYALGAGAIGAGAGAGAAYLTRPFLKDGAPTDSFIKKMNEKIKETMSQEEKELTEEIEKAGKEIERKINEAKTVEDIKQIFIQTTTGHLTEDMLEAQKKFNVNLMERLQSMGVDVKPEQVEEFSKLQSVDEVKELMGRIFDNAYAGKNVDEIKNTIKSESETLNRQIAKSTFEEFWDASKKEFVNCEEGVGKAIKKAARSIQGKYAMIYGGIAAGILGIGTYFATNTSKKTAPEKIDEQA